MDKFCFDVEIEVFAWQWSHQPEGESANPAKEEPYIRRYLTNSLWKQTSAPLHENNLLYILFPQSK